MIFWKWGGDQRPFGTFPKIHPFWEGQVSLSMVLAWQCTGALVDSSVTLGGQSRRWTSWEKKGLPANLGLKCPTQAVPWIGLPVVLKVGPWLGINCEGRLRQEICYLLAPLLEQPTPNLLPHPPPWQLVTSAFICPTIARITWPPKTQRVFTHPKSVEHKIPKNVTQWIRYCCHLDFCVLPKGCDKITWTHPTATYPYLQSKTIEDINNLLCEY